MILKLSELRVVAFAKFAKEGEEPALNFHCTNCCKAREYNQNVSPMIYNNVICHWFDLTISSGVGNLFG